MLLECVAAAALAAAPGPLKLAAPGLTGVNVSPDVALFYSNHVAQLLSLEGVQVTTATEIASMIGLERQKELLGCGDSGVSCMAELANALGVDGVVTGSIGEFEGLTQINLKVVAATDGHTLAIYSGKAETQAAMLEALKAAAASIARQLDPHAVSSSGTARRYFWAPAAVGVAAGIGAGVLLGLASGQVSALRGVNGAASTLSLDEANQARSSALLERTLGYVALGVGGAAVLTAVAMLVFGGPVTVTPTLNAGGGAGLSLQGAF